jgi:hypothetical protein
MSRGFRNEPQRDLGTVHIMTLINWWDCDLRRGHVSLYTNPELTCFCCVSILQVPVGHCAIALCLNILEESETSRSDSLIRAFDTLHFENGSGTHLRYHSSLLICAGECSSSGNIAIRESCFMLFHQL